MFSDDFLTPSRLELKALILSGDFRERKRAASGCWQHTTLHAHCSDKNSLPHVYKDGNSFESMVCLFFVAGKDVKTSIGNGIDGHGGRWPGIQQGSRGL